MPDPRGRACRRTGWLRLHINVGELTARAHERGFETLGEVKTATLYPNGTLYFEGRHGTSETSRHSEILDRLADLSEQVAALAARPAT